MLHHALAAAFKAHKQSLPEPPASLSSLLDCAAHGTAGLLGRSGVRDALGEIRARIFQMPGLDPEGQCLWPESIAAAAFAARVAQLRQASVSVAFCSGVLHRAGEALALKILARVELEFRMKLHSSSRRDWCNTHGRELAERLVRAWSLPADVAACVVGWRLFGEFAQASSDSTGLYFGRLLATELLHPDLCVPGALDYAAAELGLSAELLSDLRAEGGRVRSFIQALA